MAIIIGKIELNKEKNIVRELKSKVKGINYGIARKIIILAGHLESAKGTAMHGAQEKEVAEIITSYKGLIDYKFGVVEEEFEKVRRSNDAYPFVRYSRGYPKKGRTKSNGKTSRRRIKQKITTKVKEMSMLTRKPQNRKERKLYNKLKKLQDKYAHSKKKGKTKGKKSKKKK